MRKLAFVCGLLGAFTAASALAAPIKLSYTGVVKLVDGFNTTQLSNFTPSSTTVSGNIIFTDTPFNRSVTNIKGVESLNFIESSSITLNTPSGASTITYKGGLNPLLDPFPKDQIQYLETGAVYQGISYTVPNKYEEGFVIRTGFGVVCGNDNTDCHPSAVFTENQDLSGSLVPDGLSLNFFQTLDSLNDAFGLFNLSSFSGDIIDFTKLNVSAIGTLGFVNEGVGPNALQYSVLQFDITGFSFEAVTPPVTSDVPEAPTVAVMGMGLLGLGLARRRKAKKLTA